MSAVEQPLQCFLDSGASFEGRVAFSGVVRIDGNFRGDASSDGTLVIGDTGTVEADLELATLVIHGTFRGNVTAKDLVEIAPSAVVEGSITTQRLLIAEGAQVNASIEMAGGAG
jgi:cytoskeletal protein CcmA (bactofilin family)